MENGVEFSSQLMTNDNVIKIGDLITIVDGWHDFSCQEGDIGIFLGFVDIPRTLGEGDHENYDTLACISMHDKIMMVSSEAIKQVEQSKTD